MDTRSLLCKVGKTIENQHLVIACDGNISCRLENGNILITPSGYPKGGLTPEMLVEINMEGQLIKGNYKPSSEMNMHLAIYHNRSDIKAIVHAHPPVATAITVAGIPFPDTIVTEGRDFLGKVTIVPYEKPASHELATACAHGLQENNAILMANHGATTVGATLGEACYRMETLEAVASIYRDALIFSNAPDKTKNLSLLKG